MDDAPSFRRLTGLVVVAGILTTALVVQYLNWRRDPAIVGRTGRVLQWAMLVFIANLVVMVVRWTGYRPRPGIKDDNILPRISVVIPAYNESAFVRRSMGSVAHSAYPSEKIQLVVVDDGSSDDTWDHIRDAAEGRLVESGLEVTLLRHEENQGKRQAIATGFGAARHDVVVCLDSDSVLDPLALRNLVTPIVTEPDVGGVAGHLLALNVAPSSSRWRTTIPRLLNVLFEHGGNIPRSAQDRSGFVTILPGAISAFRRSAVAPHVDALVGRTFLGHPLRHGEDVELTLNLLADGWRTVYQSNAVVHTAVPETPYRAFLMYTRWERSSFTYLLTGFLRLAVVQALGRGKKSCIQGMRAGDGTISSPVTPVSPIDLESQQLKRDDDLIPAVTAAARLDVYPALSLTCTAMSNLMCLAAVTSRLAMLARHPLAVAGDVGCMGVLAVWTTLLLVADATGEENADSGGDGDGLLLPRMGRYAAGGGVGYGDDRDDLVLCSKAERMVWNVQYAAPSAIFQVLFVSWTSVVGLATLRSQSWLTR